MAETPIDVEKLRSLGVISRRSGDRVREWRSGDGERHKATTDELNNVVTQHSVGDRQDVQIFAPTVAVSTVVREDR